MSKTEVQQHRYGNPRNLWLEGDEHLSVNERWTKFNLREVWGLFFGVWDREETIVWIQRPGLPLPLTIQHHYHWQNLKISRLTSWTMIIFYNFIKSIIVSTSNVWGRLAKRVSVNMYVNLNFSWLCFILCNLISLAIKRVKMLEIDIDQDLAFIMFA